MKNVAKTMAIRFAVYGVLVTYLGCDLFVFQGPVYRSLNVTKEDKRAMNASAKAEGVVAQVYARPIYRAQIEEAMKEYLWRRGRTVEETTAEERKLLRRLLVNRLIDDELVKLQIKVSTSEEDGLSEEKVKAALAEEMKRYPDQKIFDELAEKAGWSGLEEREKRLAARIQRGEHLMRMVEISVSEDEARVWFEGHRENFDGPFEKHREEVEDTLLLKKKEEAWKKFRVARLRRYAEGKIDLFEDVLYEEAD